MKNLSVTNITDMIKNRIYSAKMFDTFEKREVIEKDEAGKEKRSFKDVQIQDLKMVRDSVERFKACDVAENGGKFFARAMEDSKTGKSEFFGKTSSDTSSAMKEIVGVNDYYTKTFMKDGVTPDGRKLSLADFVQEVANVGQAFKDNFAIGGVLSVMQQSIVWAGLEILPTEPDIHHLFTVPMKVEPGQIIAMPYFQMDAPGGLDYTGRQDLLTTNIGDGVDAFATMGQSGIAVHLSYQEMAVASFDLLRLHFMVANNALVQWKNMKAIGMLHNLGVTDFDNLDPTKSTNGSTTGVSLASGGPDMTMTMADFEQIKLDGINRGHDYSLCLISPEGYKVLMNTPEMKEYIKDKGMVWFPKALGASGTFGRQDEPMWRKFAGTNEESAKYNNLVPVIPQGLANHETTFVVTRHIPTFRKGDLIYKNMNFNKEGNKEFYLDSDGKKVTCGADPMTNIYLIDPKQALIYAEQRAVSMIDKEDDFREYYRAHFREGYTFHPIKKGTAIRVIRNVAVRKERKIDILSRIQVSLEEAKTLLAH